MQEEEPEVWARARHILLPKDYVRFKLTGTHAMDKADGAGTILFDLGRTRLVAGSAGCARHPCRSPPTHEGPAITGYLSTNAAVATGLHVGTPVMAGGGDQAAGAVGVGRGAAGHRRAGAGHLGRRLRHHGRPLRGAEEGRLHAFCHAVPGRWHFMGVMLSAAGSLR